MFAVSTDLHKVELPDGAYLRELVDLDLDSPEAIAAFVEAHGYPGGEIQELGPSWLELQARWGDLPERPRGLPPWPEGWERQVLLHRRKVPFLLAEFVERANLIKDLTQIQLYRRGHQDLDGVSANWGGSLLTTPIGPGHALYGFVTVMNWGLSNFQPLVNVAAPEGMEPEPRFESALGLRWRPRLFDCLYLQLFNDVARQADYARCKNSRCPRWFKVTTPDKLFCDNTCARLEAQRQFRRRGTKRWMAAAARYANEVKSTGSGLSWQQVHEQFKASRPDQPYNDLSQFRKACEAGPMDDNGGDHT